MKSQRKKQPRANPLQNKAFVDFLKKNAGDSSLGVVARLWESKRPLRDEEIAEKTGLKVTEVRTILNRLHYRGIANYQKVRDEKTGWYTYTWIIEKRKLIELIVSELCEAAQKLEKERAMQENYTLFVCRAGCTEMPFEIAAEYNFKCPECGQDLNCLNPKTAKKALDQKIREIKRQIETLQRMK